MTNYTLVELNTAIAQAVQHLTPEPIWVSGTISTWKKNRGWTRGELVIYTGTNPAAKLQLGCPTKTAIGIDKGFAQHNKKLAAGTDVNVLGQLNYHPVYGLRLNVKTIASDTAAQSQTTKNRLELVRYLHDTGIGTKQQHLTLPTDVRTIGLVAPVSGDAAREDALSILRPHNLVIDERRVATAGPQAANAIRAAIGQLETTADLILCIRGGGSSADLTVFDDKRVVTAIGNCQRPIIVGIGHATDQLLATDVAHHGATTPTAAAHWISAHLTPTPTPAPPTALPVETIYLTRPTSRRLTNTLAAAVIILLAIIALLVWRNLT